MSTNNISTNNISTNNISTNNIYTDNISTNNIYINNISLIYPLLTTGKYLAKYIYKYYNSMKYNIL